MFIEQVVLWPRVSGLIFTASLRIEWHYKAQTRQLQRCWSLAIWPRVSPLFAVKASSLLSKTSYSFFWSSLSSPCKTNTCPCASLFPLWTRSSRALLFVLVCLPTQHCQQGCHISFTALHISDGASFSWHRRCHVVSRPCIVTCPWSWICWASGFSVSVCGHLWVYLTPSVGCTYVPLIVEKFVLMLKLSTLSALIHTWKMGMATLPQEMLWRLSTRNYVAQNYLLCECNSDKDFNWCKMGKPHKWSLELGSGITWVLWIVLQLFTCLLAFEHWTCACVRACVCTFTCICVN